jgi:hypothetical protein
MKMPEHPEPALFAPCGMNCLTCYAHVRAKKPCEGCLVGDTNKTNRCKTCKIKTCAGERGLAWCFECPEFPCAPVKRLDRSYIKRYGVSLLDYSRVVCEQGLPAFMEQQAALWKCPTCGGVISLHDKTCAECGLTG